MKKNKFSIWFLSLIIMSTLAFAAGFEVVHEFDTPASLTNVDVLAYNCLDADCNNLGTFSGEIIYDKAKLISVRYPSTLQSQHGYVLFFTSTGWIPIEIRSTLAGNNKITVKASQESMLQFQKVPICTAEVSKFSINDGEVNKPIKINASSTMCAETASAFKSNSNKVGAIPSQIRDHYSAPTDVILTITNKDTSTETYKDTKSLNILLDEIVNYEWEWTPTIKGNYSVEIKSHVDSARCTQSIDSSVSSDFNVFENDPISVCYVPFANKLEIKEDNIISNTNFEFTLDWNAMMADNIGEDQNIQAKLSYQILNSSDDVIANGNLANGLPTIDNGQSFTLTAPDISAETQVFKEFRLKIKVDPSNSQCTENNSATVEKNFVVFKEISKYSLTFDLNKISGANITLLGPNNYNESKLTDGEGKAVFANLEEGDYSYDIEKNSYSSKSGFVYVDVDKQISLIMQKDNSAPQIWLENSYDIVESKTRNINLNDFVSDDNDASELLIWTIGNSQSYAGSNVSLTIDSNNQLTITGLAEGIEKVTLTATDLDGSFSSKQITFNVIKSDDNEAPVWNTALLKSEVSITMAEGSRDLLAAYLPRYVSDDTTASENIVFSIESMTFKNTHLTQAKLEEFANINVDGKYLSIDPYQDFFGEITVELKAADGEGKSSTANISIKISNLDDLPVVKKTLSQVVMNENDQNKEVDFSDVFYEGDEFIDPAIDNLTFSLEEEFADFNITIDQENRKLTIKLLNNSFSGTKQYTLAAEDKHSNKVTTVLDIKVDSENDAPVMQTINPIAFRENTQYNFAMWELANDEEDGHALTWSASGYDDTLITIAFNNAHSEKIMTINNIGNKLGQTTVTFKVEDSEGKSATQDVVVTVSTDGNDNEDVLGPAINVINKPSNANYDANAEFIWKTTVTDDDGNPATIDTGVVTSTIKLMVDKDNDGIFETTYVPKALPNNQYQVNSSDADYAPFVIKNAGTYKYYWEAYDNEGNKGRTNTETLVISKLDPTFNLTVNDKNEDVSVIRGSTVELKGQLATPAAGNLTLFIGAVQVKQETNANLITLSQVFNNVGTYTVKLVYEDIDGNYNNKNLTHDITVGIDESAPTFSDETYPSNAQYDANAEYLWKVKITDSFMVDDTTVKLVLNDGTTTRQYNAVALGNLYYQVNGSQEATIGALIPGTYTFNWLANDTASNEGSTSQKSFTISKADSTGLKLSLDTVEGNINVLKDAQVDLLGSITAPTDGTLTLYVAGTQVAQQVGTSVTKNDHLFDTKGTFEVKLTFTPADTKFNAQNVNYTVTVDEDTVAPTFSNEVNPNNAQYDPNADFVWQIKVDDAFSGVNASTVQLNVSGTLYDATDKGNGLFEVNSTNYPALKGLAVNAYTFNWVAKDKANNEATSTQKTLTITKADPEMHLSIGGHENHASVAPGTAVLIEGNITPNTKNIELFVDSVSVDVAVGTVQDTYNFATTGTYVVKLSFAGDANYNARNVSYNVVVADLPVQSNYAPASNTHLNLTQLNLQFNTDIATTCRWSLTDQAYADMPSTNAFTGAGTTSHNGQVTLASTLGSQKLYVACVGEQANSNDDLTFVLDNILDSTTLNGANAITTSKVISSTLTDSTVETSDILTSNIDNSTVKDSQFTSCVISNSYVENMTGVSSCNVIDSPHSVVNVTGSNWTVKGGSTVTNAVLNNAVIDNSVVNNSNIDDTDIEDAEIKDATIANGVITAGTIKYDSDYDGTPDTTYDAAASGSENLKDLINYAPKAVIGISPAAPNTNQNVNFDASGSTDENGDTMTYAWNFGDGSTATTMATTHAYTTAGTYTVTLTVTDEHGKQTVTTTLVTVTNAAAAASIPRSTGGGGGGSSISTVQISTQGNQMTFRAYEMLRFQFGTTRYPVTMNIYRLDTGKATLLVNGQRVELAEGTSQNFDLNRDGTPDISITAISVAKSTVTLKFLPAGVQQNNVAPPMPIFNILPDDGSFVEDKKPEIKPDTKPSETPKQDEKQEQKTGEEVQINAQVGSTWEKVKGSFKQFLGLTQEGEAAAGSSWIAMAIIAGVILLGLGIFFAVKKFYFY